MINRPPKLEQILEAAFISCFCMKPVSHAYTSMLPLHPNQTTAMSNTFPNTCCKIKSCALANHKLLQMNILQLPDLTDAATMMQPNFFSGTAHPSADRH